MNPHITIGTQKGREKKHAKLRYSPFGITINPNISTSEGTEMHEAIHDVLEYVAEMLFGSLDAIKKTISIIARDGSWDDVANIDDVNVTLEYGTQGKWHIQVFLGVHHNTMLRINIPYLRKVTAAAFEIPQSTVHVNVNTNYGQDMTANARAYSLKDRNPNETRVLA